MDDLISRKAAIEALGEEPLRWNNTITEGQEWNDWKYHVNAIKSVPSITAVPLDKLCEWLGKVAIVRCNGCSQNLCAGDACSSSNHWEKEIKKWMEGLDAADSYSGED